jgi:putative serine protease PepD
MIVARRKARNMSNAPQDPNGLGRKNSYNSQFLFDPPVSLPPKKLKQKKAKEKRLTFFTATSAILLGVLIGASIGAGAGVLAQNYLSRPPAIVVNNLEDVNWVTAASSAASPSVVTIRVSSSDAGGNGSGVVLTSDGYILTNAHVVTVGGTTAGVELSVRTSQREVFPARIIGTDPTNDLAVIKIETTKPLTPMVFADSSKINVGDQVVAIGAPLGLEATVTRGIVSALNRTIQVASSEDPNETGLEFWSGSSVPPVSLGVIQTDAAINPGNSGGALVNVRGELIGINVAIARTSGSFEGGSIGVGFAIPSNLAERVAKDIMETGEATHGVLGVLIGDAMSSENGSAFPVGALVIEVTPGGAAEGIGIRPDDIVVKLNGKAISSASELTSAVRQEKAGTEVEIEILRDGELLTFDVVL